jgi:hypothetical protein
LQASLDRADGLIAALKESSQLGVQDAKSEIHDLQQKLSGLQQQLTLANGSSSELATKLAKTEELVCLFSSFTAFLLFACLTLNN